MSRLFCLSNDLGQKTGSPSSVPSTVPGYTRGKAALRLMISEYGSFIAYLVPIYRAILARLYRLTGVALPKFKDSSHAFVPTLSYPRSSRLVRLSYRRKLGY